MGRHLSQGLALIHSARDVVYLQLRDRALTSYLLVTVVKTTTDRDSVQRKGLTLLEAPVH